MKHPQRIAYRRLFVSRCGFVARICQISPDVQSKLDFIVPFKHHLKGRRHIPRQRHWLTNWRDYDAAIRNRGSLTVWFGTYCVHAKMYAARMRSKLQPRRLT